MGKGERSKPLRACNAEILKEFHKKRFSPQHICIKNTFFYSNKQLQFSFLLARLNLITAIETSTDQGTTTNCCPVPSYIQHFEGISYIQHPRAKCPFSRSSLPRLVGSCEKRRGKSLINWHILYSGAYIKQECVN